MFGLGDRQQLPPFSGLLGGWRGCNWEHCSCLSPAVPFTCCVIKQFRETTHKQFVLLCFFHTFYFCLIFFHMSLWEHNAKNVIKEPLTLRALQIFLIKATAFCCGGKKIKHRASENVFLGRVGEAAEDETFSLYVMSFVTGTITQDLQGHPVPVESCGFIGGSCLQKVE